MPLFWLHSQVLQDKSRQQNCRGVFSEPCSAVKQRRFQKGFFRGIHDYSTSVDVCIQVYSTEVMAQT